MKNEITMQAEATLPCGCPVVYRTSVSDRKYAKICADRLLIGLGSMLDYPREHVCVSKVRPAEVGAANAPAGLPTDFRVTWEIDTFNAETPREAAEEARSAMQRAHTTATVFTVLSADGATTVVDLSEEG